MLVVFCPFPEQPGRLRLIPSAESTWRPMPWKVRVSDYLHIDPQDERAGSEIQARINAHQAGKFFQTRLAVLGQHPDEPYLRL